MAQAEITSLQKAVNYQKLLQKQNKVPNKYIPKLPLKISDISLKHRFVQQYKQLFRSHLEAVINSNIITLEIKKTHLSHLIKITETEIASNTPIEHVRDVYHLFLTTTGLKKHEPTPVLKAKLATTTDSPTTPTQSTETGKRQEENQPNSTTNTNRLLKCKRPSTSQPSASKLQKTSSTPQNNTSVTCSAHGSAQPITANNQCHFLEVNHSHPQKLT